MKLTGVLTSCALLIGAADLHADEPPRDPGTAVDALVGAGDDLADVALEDLLAVPVVESAGRRAQSRFEVAASVTALDDLEIAGSVTDSIPALLRRVPGAWVVQPSATDWSVGLRGLGGPANKHVVVLLDGRSVGDATFGYTPWSGLPVHPGDLERIEVVSGPSSMVYGADALSGVISLRTKRPLDHVGAEFWLAGGAFVLAEDPALEPRRQDEPISGGGHGYIAENFADDARTMGLRLSAGFGAIPRWDRNDPVVTLSSSTLGGDVPLVASAKHGEFAYHGMATGELRPSADQRYTLSISHSLSEPELVLSELLPDVPQALSEQAVVASAEHKGLLGGALSLQASLDGRRFSNDLPLTVNSQVSDYSGHLFTQATWQAWARRSALSIGAEGAYHQATEMFDARPTSLYLGTFVTEELRVLDDPVVIVSAGLRLERIGASSDDTELVYRNASPRLGAVLNLDDRHGVWLSAGSAYRTPKTFEALSRVFGTVPAGFEGAPVEFLAPNPALRPTRARSLELGYRGRPLDWLALESTGFAQRIDDLVGFRPVAAFPFQLDNVKGLDQLGAIASVKVAPSPGLSGYAHYAFTASWDRDGEPVYDWPRHIAGLGGEVALPAEHRIGLDFYTTSSVRPTLLGFEDAFIRNRPQRAPVQAALDLRWRRPLLGGKLALFAAAKNLLAPLRERAELRTYAAASNEPIGTSLLIGVSGEGL